MVHCVTKRFLIGLSNDKRHNADTRYSVLALIVMITCSDLICNISVCGRDRNNNGSVVLNAFALIRSPVIKVALISHIGLVVVIKSSCRSIIIVVKINDFIGRIHLACTVGNIPCAVIRAFVTCNHETCRKVRDIAEVVITADVYRKICLGRRCKSIL